MAEKTKKEAAATKEQIAAELVDATRNANLLGDKAIVDAMAEIDKEKDEKKKEQAKIAICKATYYNSKTRIELRQRRREDDITQEKLTRTKELLERVIGVRTEIGKNGELVPTKEKVDAKELLTPTEFSREKDKLSEEIRKKISENDKMFRDEIQELRNSYEGRYCWYNDWD